MKVRIAPHASRDKNGHNLNTDSSQCPPTGIRFVASIATIMKWPVAKIDFKSAFSQTSYAKGDVHAIPHHECRNRHYYWFLLEPAYNLVNANAKWL